MWVFGKLGYHTALEWTIEEISRQLFKVILEGFYEEIIRGTTGNILEKEALIDGISWETLEDIPGGTSEEIPVEDFDEISWRIPVKLTKRL